MSKLYKASVTAPEDSIEILFMSDNLFVAYKDANGCIHWGSFDVSKMEGAHDRKDVEGYIDLTFSSYRFSDGDEKFIHALKRLSYFAAIDTPAVLNRQVFQVPYLSSGCPQTSDYNCLKMSKAVRILWRIWA